MTRSHGRPSFRWSVIHILLAALVLTGGAIGAARLTDRSADARAIQVDSTIPPVPRPIYIYAGACGELGEVAWPLNNLTSPDGSAAGSDDADRTEYSFTSNVPLTIDALLAGSFAINIHESSENPDQMLACGNVGGVPDAVGTLVLGLRIQGDLDVTGIAVLSPSPSDLSRTLVSVFITGSALGDQTGTIKPESTAIPDLPVVDNTNPPGGDPTVIVVPTTDDPVVEPTEIEVEPTEVEIEPTEEDDDHGGDDDEEDEDDNSGEDDDEDNSGQG